MDASVSYGILVLVMLYLLKRGMEHFLKPMKECSLVDIEQSEKIQCFLDIEIGDRDNPSFKGTIVFNLFAGIYPKV